MLVHENTRFIPRMRRSLDDELGGIVVTGDKADERAFQLRTEVGYSGPLLIDAAPYKSHTATADEPFLLPSDEMFADVETSLSFQKARGASAALTPTGYIEPENAKALKAVWRASQRIERGDVIVSLPVDAAWLKDSHIRQLIAVCQQINRPKALILAGQFDPLEGSKEMPGNLRRLMSEVEHIALLRTDLAALDAMAFGATFAGIGSDSSLRHSVAPGERALVASGGGAQYPKVLLPNLMCFKGAVGLANKYANTPPPVCHCEECDGQALDRFDKPDGQTRQESEDHNVLVWSAWFSEMATYAAGTDRQAWWRDKCAAAVEQYALENQRLGVSSRGGFQVPAPLKAWATLPGGAR
ncbi:hypothetical protein ACFRMQ_29775 [Kitasatospora sp. NPDC056783]|uniref:hypothetical protein n=1 Tax=Kitasatospora sp. NPDC056783 TaxID=3345943 RepID=UPI0036B202FB